MSANTKNNPLAGAAQGPVQTINAYILANMLEQMANDIENDHPYNDQALNTWAMEATATDFYGWIWDNPDTWVIIQWPTTPLGRDNQRIHALYARIKEDYMELNHMSDLDFRLAAEYGAKELTFTRVGVRPGREKDPQRQNNSDQYIELARATARAYAHRRK